VFFHNIDQKKAAEAMKEKLQNPAKFGNKKIVTEIVQTSRLWKAEEYPQSYYTSAI
jgi:peptide methionine sulfoxide reductase MsrA